LVENKLLLKSTWAQGILLSSVLAVTAYLFIFKVRLDLSSLLEKVYTDFEMLYVPIKKIWILSPIN